ncbi:hypothetical protein CH337_18620 [Rhodoblastus acidophilus]|nr:hypothetical protein CKO16_20730 [Rhodoblastus acidophilus]RAI16958.1 hypothetical protein CH337_18620 [Rhodoblastus acidophilus]
MNESTLPLPGLSPVAGKSVVVKFDGGSLSSDGGILALREVEQRLRVADRLIKIAARVVEMKTMIKVHLPTACPVQETLRLVLTRIPRLVT